MAERAEAVNPARPRRASGSRGCSRTGATSWRRATCRPGRAIDGVSRWLLITRACVFPMTLTSALIGGLLAALTRRARRTGATSRSRSLGLVLAHAANNMINDYFDTDGGVDTEELHARALRAAPDPLGADLEEGPARRHRRREPRRPRDPAACSTAARGWPVAGVRAGRPLHQRLLRGAAAQAEAPRPRRARRVRRVGPADDRRHLLRDRRARCRRGCGSRRLPYAHAA